MTATTAVICVVLSGSLALAHAWQAQRRPFLPLPLPLPRSRRRHMRAATVAPDAADSASASASALPSADDGEWYTPLTAAQEVELEAAWSLRDLDQLTALDLAAELGSHPTAAGPWRSLFEGLVGSEVFGSEVFGKRPFKWDNAAQFAVDAFTVEDVRESVHLIPPQFTARGVVYGEQKGIYNKPFEPGFSMSDIEETMEEATVVLLNAGFCVPALACVAQACLDVFQMPIWLNVYMTKPGLQRSTQLHTDKQDVLLVQVRAPYRASSVRRSGSMRRSSVVCAWVCAS